MLVSRTQSTVGYDVKMYDDLWLK